MNCGPGSIGGCFVHSNHSEKQKIEENVRTGLSEQVVGEVTGKEIEPHFQQVEVNPPRFAGWWGHRLNDRFVMAPQFIPCDGVYGYRLSNPPVLLIAGARASLDLFDRVNILQFIYILIDFVIIYLFFHRFDQ